MAQFTSVRLPIPMDESNNTPKGKPGFFCLPFWCVACTNLFVVFITIPFYFLPRGELVRPMGWSMLAGLTMFPGFGGIALGMLRRYDRVPHQWLIILLGLSPVPLALLLFWLAVHIRGFIPEP